VGASSPEEVVAHDQAEQDRRDHHQWEDRGEAGHVHQDDAGVDQGTDDPAGDDPQSTVVVQRVSPGRSGLGKMAPHCTPP
jgi:hypothetical protein